jgi:hypothetical protein
MTKHGDSPTWTKADKALELVETLARVQTPEEAFENLRDENGIVHDDGVEYDDVDEMISDLGDDFLMDEYGAFMDFVRAAKEIVKEGADE